MATNLSKINSFLMNDYIDTINNFVGKKIIENVTEYKAVNTDSETVNFIKELAYKIKSLKQCERNCPFRKEL